MKDNIFVSTENGNGYDILIRRDFNDLADALNELGFKGRRLCVISDDNVFPLYGEELKRSLGGVSENIYNVIFKAGEANKNLDTVREIYKLLQDTVLTGRI